MSKEIGGYFELEQFLCKDNNEYHKGSIHLNLGRNALEYLIKCKGIKSIYLPYFLCNSVSDVCKKNKIKIKYYHVDRNFMPILRKSINSSEFVYIVNYYGVLSKKDITSLKAKHKNIILDNVHAFYETPLYGVDTLYSCRKFFGVPDGAYLYTDTSLNIPMDDSKKRFNHLKGRLVDGAEEHYSDYVSNEKLLDTIPLLSMSKETEEIMSKINYGYCKKRRLANFAFLKNQLSAINKFKAKINGVPFCYPLLVKDGAKLKKYLISQKIFVPTLWPNLIGLNSFERDIVENMVLIPCDQRYDKRDMDVIVSAINEWIKPKGIHVRELSLSDTKIINQWHNNKSIFNYLVGDFYGPTFKESQAWIKRYLQYENNTFRGIVSNADGIDLGVVYLIDCGNKKEAEVGIFIADERYRHLGYGEKMLCWLINFGFDVLKLNKIVLYTLENNKNAINLYEKLGFIADDSKDKVVNKNNKKLVAKYMFLERKK